MQHPPTFRPPPPGRLQFSLGQLLALAGFIAALLGAWRVMEVHALIPAAAALLLAPLVTRRVVWRFTWVLPLVWTCVAWTNFSYPGDEYGGFGVGSLAGIWIVVLIPFTSDPNQMLPAILVAGAATVTGPGFLLDKLRASWPLWIAMVLVVALLLFQASFGSFPSVERALSKNGSYAAYVLPAINLGLYAATAALLAGTSLYRLVQRLSRSRPTGD